VVHIIEIVSLASGASLLTIGLVAGLCMFRKRKALPVEKSEDGESLLNVEMKELDSDHHRVYKYE